MTYENKAKTLGVTAITHNQLSAAENLFRLHGVVGYSSAYQSKITGGMPTNQPCIRIYVKHKVSKSLCVITGRLIPKAIDGIPTDVVDIQGEPKFLNIPTGRHRPVVGGVSTIGPWGGINCPREEKRSAGTVTITALNENNEPRSLSNYHVWNNSGPDELCAERGDPCIQPGGADGGRCPDDTFGTLDDWKDLAGATGQEEFDSATVKPSNPSMVKVGEVFGAGQVTAFRDPQRTDRPSVYGRTSGVIHNLFFADLFGTFRVQGYGCKTGKFYCYFRNQVLFSPPTTGGDSGSPIIVKEGDKLTILAQVFAGTQGIGIASKIRPIFTYFKLHLPTEAPPPPPPDDIVSAQLTVTGPTGPVVKDMVKGTGKEWDGTATLTTAGTHTMKATAVSKNGNTGSETITIIVEEDGQQPFVTVKFITPTDGTQVKKGTLPIKIEAEYHGQY